MKRKEKKGAIMSQENWLCGLCGAWLNGEDKHVAESKMGIDDMLIFLWTCRECTYTHVIMVVPRANMKGN